MRGHKTKRFDVLFGEAGKRDVGIRQVDSLIGGQIGAGGPGVLHGDDGLAPRTILPYLADAAGDRAIIENHPVTHLERTDHLRQRAPNGGHLALDNARRLRGRAQHQLLAAMQANLLFQGRNPMHLRGVPAVAQHRSLGEVAVAITVQHRHACFRALHREHTGAPPRFGEAHLAAGVQARQPLAIHL